VQRGSFDVLQILGFEEYVRAGLASDGAQGVRKGLDGKIEVIGNLPLAPSTVGLRKVTRLVAKSTGK
jgi:hypothetical protein